MASGSASSPSVSSTVVGVKRKSKDIGWDYGVLPDPNNTDKVKCTLCEKVVSGGITRLKQHIGQITGQVSSCPKATKADQLRCRDAINEQKLKRHGREEHDKAIRSEVRMDTNESATYEDELHDSLGSIKEPNVFGPMDNFANKVNPEESLKKGKNVDLGNAIRKDRIWMAKKYISRWAYESAIPFHAFERDSFKMLLEVVGQFGTGLPPPTRYELSTTLLKEEVERTKNLVKRNEEEWKEDGCSIMTDAWSDRKRRSIMNLCVNSRMGTVFLSSMECSSEAHTSEHIYEYVEGCIKEIGAEHVVQIVTDNASNNMGAAKLLKVSRPKIFWTSCATHTINLMLEGIGALPRYKKILDQAKKLTIFIYSHHKTLSIMHLTAYLLNPYYFYKDPQIQHDPDVSDAVLEYFETIFAGDLEMQKQVVTVELPKYKKKLDRFGKELATSSCQVNNDAYDPAIWWGSFGGATPNLKKIATRILSLTSSSSGCERNWSTFEGIHTKKRNRLEATKLNNLVYVQFNSNLMEKNKRRKERNVEVLLSNDSHMAQDWVAECDGDGDEEVEVQPDSEAHWEAVGEAVEADEYLQPRQSSRAATKTTPRELFDEDFESESEEVVYEEGEYESDGIEIIEGCGDEE